MTATLFLSGFTVVAAAGDPLVPCGGPGQHACTICDFFEMTRRVSNYIIFWIIPVLTAFFLLIGGGYLIWSKGDPAALVSSKNVIKVTIIGFIVIFIGWIFVNTMFMVLGIAEWDGFKLNESWWKVSAKCSHHEEVSEECGDGIWQIGEGCDPNMTVLTCQGHGGYSVETCNEIIDNCDPDTCKAEYCGDGEVESGEECDYNEPLWRCKKRKPSWTDKKCQDTINNCNDDCKIIAEAICEAADKSKIGKGCWLTNDPSDREKYCQRGKYICEDDPSSPNFNKVVCKGISPKIYDECCLNGGDNLDDKSFDIVRIRDYVKLGVGGGLFDMNQMVPCESASIDCDTICKDKGKVCVGVGLANWQKNKCIYVIHHDFNNCNLSQNLASNDCRSKYCITSYICCEGGDNCDSKLEPCCKGTMTDPAYGPFTGKGAMFSVGETACYCE